MELNDSTTRESKINEINNSIDRVTEIINEKFSLCLAMDGIDRYFQDVYSKNELNTKKVNEEIESLLGIFKSVLDNINNLCIILSLNSENYKKMIDVTIANQTFRRRIIVPNGVNGKPVEFEKLNEKEAYELVSKFMERWIERDSINTENISEYTVIWPFEQKAITTAWKVSTSVGGIVFTLNETLKEKLNHKISSFKDMNISEVDISRVVFRNKLNSYFTDEQGIWSEIEILAREDEIKAKLQKLNENSRNALPHAELADSFQAYLEELGFVREVGKRCMVIHSETYGNKKIYLKFIDGTKINPEDARILAEDVRNSNSGAGLFICIGETDEDKIEFDSKCEDLFKDYTTNDNFVSAVGSRLVNRVEASNIMNLKEIEKDTRKIYAEYLDRKLGFKQYLKSLEFTEYSYL